MTAQISAYGRLVADPQTRTTTNGNNMAMARLAVSLPCNATEAGESTFWLGIIAFGKQADSVLSARTVRPSGKAGQQGLPTDTLRLAQQPSRDEYDQRPPFDAEAPASEN